MPEKYVLKLYITGRNAKTQTAVNTLTRICEAELKGQYQLIVIDILEHPQLAEDERILTTPTLIKVLPQPLRRIIGDLSNTEKVLLGLDLHPFPSQGADSEPHEDE